MISALDLKTLAETSSAGIVNCLVEGTAVAALGAFLFRVLRRYGAGVRFTVLFSALVGVAVLPLFSGVWAPVAPGITGPVVPGGAAVVLPGAWAVYLFAAWALIALIALFRVGLGLVHLWRLRSSCRLVEVEKLSPVLQDAIRECAGGRRVELCASSRVQSPAAVGLFKPAVIIPAWLLEELSPAELNHVLLHEFAHLRRRDDWTNLVQKIIKAVCFFHPAVWWIERRVSLEREMACDDAVLARTEDPRSYAECLMLLTEKNLLRRSLALAQAAVGRLRHTSLRIVRILAHNQHAKRTGGWKLVTFVSASMAGLCIIGIAAAPKLVAFKDNPVPLFHPVMAAPAALANGSTQRAREYPARNNFQPEVVPASLKLRTSGTKPKARAAAKPLLFHPRNREGQQPIRTEASGLALNAGIRLAKAEAVQPVAAETVLIFVQNTMPGNDAVPAYEISVWHVIVLRTTVAPVSPDNSRKEI